MKLKSCIFIMLLFGSAGLEIQAENSPASDTIKIDRQKLSLNISKFALLYQDATRSLPPGQLAALAFMDTVPSSLKISPGIVQKDLYLKFNVKNEADTLIKFYFFPGIFLEKIDIYRLQPGGKIEEQPLYPDELTGFRKLELEPHQSATFIAKLKFIKTTTNSFTPIIIRDYYQSSFATKYQNFDKGSNIITYVFSGILLMMIFYSLAVFVLNGGIEFLYYAGFAFCLGLMLFLKSFYFGTPSFFNNFFEAYLDFVMQSIGTFIYLAFLSKFIDTKNKFPWLHTIIVTEQFIIIISLGLFTYLYFATNNFIAQNDVEVLTKYIWSLGTIIFIVYAIRKKDKLLNYLAVGHSFLLVGGLISLFIMGSPGFRKILPVVLNNSLIYYELGLAAELMFFLTALAFKNRKDIVERTKEREQLKLITERQDFEKLLAVLSAQQDERNRISADMHDELGSGVTAIRLMSEILRAKMKENVFPEIDKISRNANELIIKMNTLIWTMKSDNDTVESLVTYIRIYALEFFDNTSIDCIINIPASFSKIELTGEKRRNLFLSVKESLNNVLKHSKADKVTIAFQIGTKLIIFITDDGVGLDHNKLRRFGSGLNNIKKRIEGIEGTYKIENNPGKGAKTTIELSL